MYKLTLPKPLSQNCSLKTHNTLLVCKDHAGEKSVYPQNNKPFQNSVLVWLFKQSFQSNFHHDINTVSAIVCK